MTMAEEIRKANRTLAQSVRMLRGACRFTVEEAAWRAELGPRHWQGIEAGEINPTLATIAKVAVALEVAIADLFSARAAQAQNLEAERDAWREMAQCLGRMACDRAQGLVQLDRFKKARQALIALGLTPPLHPEHDRDWWKTPPQK